MFEKEFEQINKERVSKISQLKAIAREKFFQCGRCKAKTKFKTLVVIAEQHYIEPWGCTGGDYWVEAERNIVCPKCLIVNRVLSDEAKKKYMMEDKYHWGELSNDKIFHSVIKFCPPSYSSPDKYIKIYDNNVMISKLNTVNI